MGANPNKTDKDGNTALHYLFTVFSRDTTEAERLANLLLENGADPNEENDDNWCPLHIAAKKGIYEAIKFVLDYNRACYFNKKKIPFNLIKKGSQDNNTIMHLAAVNQHINIVELLLLNGYDIFIVNADNKRPLNICQKNSTIAKLLN